MGESLAKNELFLFFVRMLQKVSFEQTVNKPDVNNKTYGITTLPKPFEVKVVAKWRKKKRRNTQKIKAKKTFLQA